MNVLQPISLALSRVKIGQFQPKCSKLSKNHSLISIKENKSLKKIRQVHKLLLKDFTKASSII